MEMKNKIKNKKALVGGALQELVATFVVAFILVTFFLLSSLFGLPKLDIEKVSTDINEQIYEHYFVFSRLSEKITVTYDSKNHEMKTADLVKLTEIDENAEKILEAQGLVLESKSSSFYIQIYTEKIQVSKK